MLNFKSGDKFLYSNTVMEKELSVDILCPSCGGTGLYHGPLEKENEWVTCKTCDGTGCYHLILFYIPFETKLTIKERDELAKENGKPHWFGSY